MILESIGKNAHGNSNERPCYFSFKSKKVQVINRNGNATWYPIIVIENKLTGLFLSTAYTNYFYSIENKLLNAKYRTKEIHAGIIVMFLNYIFFNTDRTKRIGDISEITLKKGNDFLKQYSDGSIGGNDEKTLGVAEKAEGIVTRFYKFLVKEKAVDFSFIINERQKKHKYTEMRFEVDHNLFNFKYPEKVPLRKAKYLSREVLSLLIELSEIYCPEITLGIVLQTFAGLRAGAICSLSSTMLNYQESLDGLRFMELDLREEIILRDDAKSTGSIKRYRLQAIYPSFLNALYPVLKKHLNMIGQNKNKFKPLFLDNNCNAMTTQTYYRRIRFLKMKLIQHLVNSDSLSLRSQGHILSSVKFGSHVFRYFFSQFVAQSKKTNSVVDIASYRGDSNLNSAIVYLTSTPEIRKEIRNFHEIEHYKIKNFGSKNDI